MSPRSAWVSDVHDHYLPLGGPFTAAEAVTRFGPPRSTTPEKALDKAAAEGWFMRIDVDSARSYRAIDGDARQARENSYFDGIKRVRSVFELGDCE